MQMNFNDIIDNITNLKEKKVFIDVICMYNYFNFYKI